MKEIIITISSWIIPAIVLLTILTGIIKKIPVYETFIDGAKDGLKVSYNIFPYLLAIIVAVSMLRASGAIEILGQLLSSLLNATNIPVDILPIMIIRSLSGSIRIIFRYSNKLWPRVIRDKTCSYYGRKF